MCGIAGAFDFAGAPIAPRLLDRLREQIAHRGPDGVGSMIDGNVGLAHTRLAILDLTDGASQPMWSADRRACLCFNGEIYNFRDIRSELEAKGSVFRSTGDTEVLLEACVRWGVRTTLDKLNGMFAFAYWDAVDNELWLARDRMGIKPLYYRCDGRQLVFASEIKALLAVSAAANEPDLASLWQLLDGGTTWEPYTLFQGVRALQPGHFVRLRRDAEGPEQQPYWSVFDNINEQRYRENERASFADVSEHFTDLMRHSIEIHAISDAPLAALASGGIDSSLICALAQDSCPGMSLYHAEVVGAQSEAAFARRVAEHVGSPLVVARMDGQDYVDQLVKTTWFHEAPSAYHPNDVPFQIVSRRASQDGIKVLLTGEGADELFIGYGHACKRILRQRLLGLFDLGGGVLRPLRKLIAPPAEDRLADVLASRGEQQQWLSAANAAYGFVKDPVERSAMVGNALHLTAHLNSLLQRNDRMGMMHGIESRIPFLENAVVEFAINLPLRHKHPSSLLQFLRGHPMKRNKAVVREASRKYLPQDIVRRKKLGFPVDPEAYLKIDGGLFRGGFLEGALSMRHQELDGVVSALDGDKRWNLFATEIFGRLFFLGESVDSVAARLQPCALPKAA